MNSPRATPTPETDALLAGREHGNAIELHARKLERQRDHALLVVSDAMHVMRRINRMDNSGLNLMVARDLAHAFLERHADHSPKAVGRPQGGA